MLSFSSLLAILLAAGIATIAALTLLLQGQGASPAQLEQQRRLAINAVGRIIEGQLIEVARPAGASPPMALVYSYSVSGVEYSAGQDISALLSDIPDECCTGATVSVKYDPHNPSNSILICEKWSGLVDNAHGKHGHRMQAPALTSRSGAVS